MEIIRNFDSVSEFVDYASGASEMKTPARSSRNTGEAAESFTGTKTWTDAQSIAFSWAEGAKQVEREIAKMGRTGTRARRTAVMSEVGPGSLSMGSYLSGHPQPWVTLQDGQALRPGKGKVVRILVNICVSGGVSKEVMARRGAAVLSLVKSLEHAGRRVEVVAVMANGGGWGGTQHMEYRITIKRAAQKVNLRTMAFAFIHPSFFRRFVFSAMERENPEVRAAFNIGMGYGSVRDSKLGDSGKYDVVLDSMMYGNSEWKNAETAAAWTRGILEVQGVQLSDRKGK